MKRYKKILIPVLIFLILAFILAIVLTKNSSQILNSTYNLKEQTSANSTGVATRNVEVEKRWKVPEDVAQNYQVTVRLIAVVGETRKNATYADGTEVPTQTIRGNLGTTIFENVPVYEDGTKIKYEAEEIKVEKSLGINPQTGEEDFQTIPLEKFKVAYEFYEKQIPEETPQGEPLEIGDEVEYTTTLNGQTLDNWKVFYVDGDYTYIILGDYLPNEYISSNILTTHDLDIYETYGICANNNREDLISAMTTKSNWDSLLTGSVNGHAVNETRTANVWAMGAPTIDLWVNSWHTRYPNDIIYTRYVGTEEVDDDNFYETGYAVGDLENPTTDYINLKSKEGYNNTLYFPHQGNYYYCEGYWLASPSTWYNGVMTVVGWCGYIQGDGASLGEYAFRPVVRLPSSVLNQ